MGAAALVTLAVTLALQLGGGASEARVNAPCLSSAVLGTVGTITAIPHTSVYSNNNYVGSPGGSLKERQYLCTDSSGEVLFTLRKYKTTKCSTKPNSRMRLYPLTSPPGNVVVLFLSTGITPAGKSWCSAGGKASAWYGVDRVPPKARIFTADPVFGVLVTKRDALVQNTYGFLAIYTPALRRPILLGPEQQIRVLATGVVQGPVDVILTPEDRAAIADLGTAVPRPNYARPAAGSSKVLARVYARRELRVGLDPGKATTQVAEFTKRYFTALAQRWKLRLAIVPNDAPEALAEGLVDVVVTPTRGAGAVEVETLPFTQQRRTDWDLELLPESDLVGGFRRYVRSSLEAADYARHYRAAFSAAPSYERFRTFLFPVLPASAPG